MAVYHRILVPLDTSDLADRVLDTALGTAAWSGAEIVLLHVSAEGVRFEDSAGTREDLEAIDRDTDEMLERAYGRGAARLADRSKIRGEVRAGDVVDVIVGAVEDLLCDLVVMGSHGRSGLVEAIAGSTTEQTARKVPASIFVVRPQGYPYLRD